MHGRDALERYPAEYSAWASAAGRPLAPAADSPSSTPRVVFPQDGARFEIDRSYRAQQIVLQAQSAESSLGFILDGRLLATRGAPYRVAWSLVPGAHELVVVAGDGRRSESVHFVVGE